METLPPLGFPLSRHAGCVFFFLVMSPPFSNSTYSRIYSAILNMKRTIIHLAAKHGKKEEKRKHDSGKLSDGDQIDLMIII